MPVFAEGDEPHTKTCTRTPDGKRLLVMHGEPSVVYKDKRGRRIRQEWHLDHVYHRTDGPAVIAGKEHMYYVMGKRVHPEIALHPHMQELRLHLGTRA